MTSPPNSHSSLDRDERGTSTTLDVTLCLLLVSAAVAILAGTAPPGDDHHDPGTAAQVADRLATTTVTVTFDPSASDALRESADRSVSQSERTVHGTPAMLLARAAVADLRVNPAPIENHTGANTHTPSLAARPVGSFGHAVETHTRQALVGVDGSVQVVARYTPIGDRARTSDTAIVGRVAVGPEPPDDVDVSVRRVRVPVGTSATATPTALDRAAESGGFEALSTVLADATLDTMLPPPRAQWGMRDDAMRPAVAARFHELAASLDSPVAVEVDGRRQPTQVREALASALAAEYEVALRSRYESPTAAAAAVDPTVVTVTIRTWSR